MGEGFWLIAMATVAYVALALAAVRHAGQHDHQASARLAVVFATLGAIGTAFIVADVVDTSGRAERILVLGGFVGLMAYPPVLLWFVDALEHVPARARAAVSLFGATFGAILAWRIVDGGLPTPFGASLSVLQVVFAAVWALTHTIAARSLWQIGSHLGSSLARRRARAMVAGIAGLGGVFAIPLLLPVAATQAAVALGVVSAVSLWLGFAPPRALRLTWGLPDVAALEAAEAELLRTGDVDVVTRDLLPAVTRVLDGDAAWITEGELLLAVCGARPATIENVSALLGEGDPSRDIEAVNVGGGRWLIAAPTGSGWLVVRTFDESVLFGTPQFSGLRSLAVRCNLLLRRTEIELRERETERRLREARHLEEVSRLKDDMLSTVSHELRTPLVTIRGASELLVARWDSFRDDQRRTFIERIDANARDLHGVVTDALHLATLRSRSATVERRRHTVGQLVSAAAETFDPDEQARLEVDGMRHTLDTDGPLLTGVLRQLISNALKFSVDPVHVRSLADESDLTIEVVDAGPGIPPTEVRKVTEPMFRSGDVLRRETRGLGIGLTLAARVTETLGGHLDIRTNTGPGTTIAVTLPTETTAASATDATTRPGDAIPAEVAGQQ